LQLHRPSLTPLNAPARLHQNFNGTAIAAGDYVWFNAVLKVNGLGSAPATILCHAREQLLQLAKWHAS
jgi:hypothetical protein